MGDPNEGITKGPIWNLPRAALEVSQLEMASDGRRGCEGIALWAGTQRLGDHSAAEEVTSAPIVDVTHVVLLRGNGIRRARAQITIGAALWGDVTDYLGEEEGLYLIGQIHGHPPASTVDLSDTDIRYGVQVPDYLSVVAPRYGCDERPNIDVCGVHVFEADTGYRRFSVREAQARLRITHDRHITVAVIGGDDTHAR